MTAAMLLLHPDEKTFKTGKASISSTGSINPAIKFQKWATLNPQTQENMAAWDNYVFVLH